ncbi:SDR family NAD(P)-dependent oxidoreductase [Silvibacterium sp.]|uniref:SDR family NAD(P)-dependent oxidoreductase n=1 Tax=Silvibacterium sp. TaxID=1964179 RepID=UPI0039E61EA3
MGKLTGKIALVTGANSGLGFATAKEFAAEGAHVFLTARRKDKLDEAVAKIGPDATAIQADVSKLEDLDRIFEQIQREKGRLDIVVANAGIARYGVLGTITEKDYYDMFDTNVKGTLFTVQKALPLLPEGASIIVLGSVVGSKGSGSNSVYASTKAAIRSFARTWTTDLKARQIRVNTISPGPIDTEGLRGLFESAPAGEARRNSISATVPLGRLGQPQEIAKAAVYLASNDSSYVTGIELFVDGGYAQV